MLNLSKINPRQASNDGSDVIITLDGDATGAVIRVRGKYSDVAENLQRAAIRKVQREYKKAGKFVPQDPQDSREERIEYAAACTIGWSGIIRDEKEVPFDEAAASALYAEHTWILDQVDAAIGDDSRFLKG